MRRSAVWLMAFLLLLAAAGPARAADPLPLVWRSPLPQGNALLDVAYGDAGFVAVGAGGAIVTSLDGLTWTLRPSHSRTGLNGVAFGGGLYVAVGWVGQIITSADGAAWKAAASGVTEQLTSVVYAEGLFLAVGSRGTVLTSTDGAAWRKHEVGTADNLERVAFGNGRFVAVGYEGAHVLRLEDGAAGGGVTVVPGHIFNIAYSRTVAFGNGRFVSVGSGRAITSADGEDWAVQPISAGRAQDIDFAGGKFFAFGRTPAVSPDGLQWQAVAEGFPGYASAVAFGAGRYVAVGASGAILASADGTAWQDVTRRSLPDYFTPKTVTYGQGLWVAAGGGIATSSDGLRWSRAAGVGFGCCQALAIGPDRMVGVGNGGGIITSGDGTEWAPTESPTRHHLKGAAYGNDQFVVVGLDGEVFTSPDGLAWTQRESGLKPYSGELKPFLNDVAFTGGSFVAVGDMGTILFSSDGAAWRQQDVAAFGDLTAVAAGGGLTVAVGAYGVMLVSADGGETWRYVPRVTDGDLTGVAYGGGRWVAVGEFGQVLTSADALTWVRDTTGGSQSLTDVAYGSGQFLLVGAGGSLLSVAAPEIPAPVCTSGFADVGPDHFACQALALLGARGILSGLPDGTFQPDRGITRAEFAKALVGAFGKPPQPGPGPTQDPGSAPVAFSDVAGHWAYTAGYIQAAVSMKAVGGFPDGRFGPDLPLTRAQAVKIVAAAAGMELPRPGEEGLLRGFMAYPDLPAGGWYTGWVNLGYFARLIGPGGAFPVWTERAFRGDEPITRAEAALILANIAAELGGR